MAQDEVLALRQDMTISREDFLRSLRAAVGDAAFDVAGTELRSRGPEPAWRICVVALPDLRFGEVGLPRQRVSVFLSGYDAIAAREFLDRFELYFRRGGG